MLHSVSTSSLDTDNLVARIGVDFTVAPSQSTGAAHYTKWAEAHRSPLPARVRSTLPRLPHTGAGPAKYDFR
jgi:hypothetical protein